MNITPNTPNERPDIGPEAEGKSPDVRVDTEGVTNDVQALLAFEGITKVVDLKILAEAAAFLREPTKNLADISRIVSNVGAIVIEFEIQGEEAPKQVDAMHAQLLTILCEYHIANAKNSSGSEKDNSVKLALAAATVLAKGYKNDTLLKEVNLLKA